MAEQAIIEELFLEYRAQLMELTNTRALINNLTEIASESRMFADGIAKVIMERIQEVPSQLCIPPLYLMDSIIKNVGAPYSDLFRPHLEALFMQKYSTSPPELRNTLGRLLATWREYFPVEHQRICQHVEAMNLRLGSQPTAGPRNTPASNGHHLHQPQLVGQTPPPAQNVAQAQILSYTQRAPQQGHRPVQPHTHQQQHVAQGQVYPQGQVAPAQHSQRYLQPQPQAPAAVAPHPLSHHQSHHQSTPQPHNQAQHQMQPHPGNYLSKTHVSASGYAPAAATQFQPHMRPAAPEPHSTATHMDRKLKNGHINSFEDTVAKYQRVGDAYNSTHGSAIGSKLPMASLSNTQAPSKSPPPDLHARTSPVVDMRPSPNDFSTENLRRRNPDAISSIYKNLPYQCGQCGFRFQSKDKNDRHLDWHFRRNAEMLDRQKQYSSRKFYLKAQDWPDYKEMEAISNLEPQDITEPDQDQPQEPCCPVSEDQTSCAKCGEEFVRMYDGDRDEWVFRGVVVHPTQAILVHAKCL